MGKGERIKLLHAERCNPAEIGLALRMTQAQVKAFINRGFMWPAAYKKQQAAAARATAPVDAMPPPPKARERVKHPGHRAVAW